MQIYSKEERTFLLYHELLHALFAIARVPDESMDTALRARIRREMPPHIADHLLEVINHIWETTNDVQHQDQTP